MNKVLILLVALWAFIAVANARPLMFFADQTDAPFGISNGWSGIAYAFTTLKKGTNYHRVRVFGTNHINETLTDAWLQYENGTIIDHLAVNIDQFYRYFLGDVRMDFEAFTHLLSEKVYAVVASSNHKNGSISGYFRCRPHSGLAILNAAQVPVGSNSSGGGIGWAEITVSTIHALPQDVLDQDASIAANSLFYGRVLHNLTDATAVTFNGPANTSSTAPILATGNLTGVFQDAHFNGITPTEDFYTGIDYAQSYYLVTAASGNIRGQVYPLLSPSHRRIPYKIDTVSGNTVLPGAGLGTLRYGNQQGNERNTNSYLSLDAVINPTNYTYVGVFYIAGATNKKNVDIVRAYTVEMNARIGGAGTWLFEFFDATSGEYVPVATWTTAAQWTPAYIDDYDFAVRDFSNNRRTLVMRISVNSATPTSLYLDVFGVRSWIPYGNSNQVLKDVAKFLNFNPGEFANGTQINV